MSYDLVVIGSGPGGYIGAIRAAQLGMKVAVVERYSTLGGTCLNVGCIPSKAMLHSSEFFHQAKADLKHHGIEISEVKLDLKKMLERKDKVVGELTAGVAYLFKKNKITSISGHATFVSNDTIEVLHDGETSKVQAKNFLIATGSKPSSIPNVVIDKDRVVSSTEALRFKKVPKELVVIGAGVIGLELGSVWSRLGANVTVLEYLPNVLGNMDKELTKAAERSFKKQGITFKTGVKVTGTSVSGDIVTVTYEAKGKNEEIRADRVLVATGRKPYTHNLGLEAAGITLTDRGFIPVNDHFETSTKGIYAIGDVIGGAMLAHKAEEEAIACIERLNGIAGHVNYDAIPAIVYTWPEVASVGKTEEELKAAGIEYKVGKFSFAANGRAKALGNTEGFAKLLADAKTDRILGGHIIGPHAGDLITEVAITIEFGGSAEDLARSSHAHPTLSEVVKEAALGVDGRILNS